MSQYVTYLDRNRMWQLPFCHAVFFGLLKNMCDLLFPLAGSKAPAKHKRQKRLPQAMMALPEEKKLSKECKDRVQERARNLVSLGFSIIGWVAESKTWLDFTDIFKHSSEV